MKNLVFGLAAVGLVACQNQEAKTEAESTAAEDNYVAFDLANLDESIAPCEDFYQFSVGGWLKDNPIPSTESRWSSFNIVSDANNEKLKTILEEYSSKDATAGSMEQQLGDFYSTALDSNLADELGIQPLQEEINSIHAISTKADLISKIAYLRSVGVNPLFGIYIGQDDKNSSEYITHIYQSGLGMPDRDYYLKDDEKSIGLQEAYKTYVSKLLSLSDIENADAITSEVYERLLHHIIDAIHANGLCTSQLDECSRD